MPFMSSTRVRVVIDEEIQISNENMRRHIFGLEPTLEVGLHTVADFKKLILSKFPDADKLLLKHSLLTILDGYIVPLTESISIFRDDDLILFTSCKNGIDNSNIQNAATTSTSSCQSSSQEILKAKETGSESSSSKKRTRDNDSHKNISTSGDRLTELYGENDFNLNSKNRDKSGIILGAVAAKEKSQKRSERSRTSVIDRRDSNAVDIVSDSKETNVASSMSNLLDPQLIWQHFNQSNNPTCIVMKKYAPPPKVTVDGDGDGVNTKSKTSNRKEKKRKKRELASLTSSSSTKGSDSTNIRINLKGNSSKISNKKAIFSEMIDITGSSNDNDAHDDSRRRADQRSYSGKISEVMEGDEYSEDRRRSLKDVPVANYDTLKIGDRISYRTLELCEVTFEPVLSNTRIKGCIVEFNNRYKGLKIKLDKSLEIIDVLWNDIADVRCSSSSVDSAVTHASYALIEDRDSTTSERLCTIPRKASPRTKSKSSSTDFNFYSSSTKPNNTSSDSIRCSNKNLDNINNSVRNSKTGPDNSNGINTDIIDKMSDASNTQCLKEPLKSSMIADENSSLRSNDVGNKNKRKKQKLNLHIEKSNPEIDSNYNHKADNVVDASIMYLNMDIVDTNATYSNNENIDSATEHPHTDKEKGESHDVIYNEILQIDEDGNRVTSDCSSFSFMDLFGDELSQRRNEVK